jgi:hypothetical protein
LWQDGCAGVIDALNEGIEDRWVGVGKLRVEDQQDALRMVTDDLQQSSFLGFPQGCLVGDPMLPAFPCARAARAEAEREVEHGAILRPGLLGNGLKKRQCCGCWPETERIEDFAFFHATLGCEESFL